VTPLNYKQLHVAIICVNLQTKKEMNFNFHLLDKKDKIINSFAISTNLEEGANRIDLEISNFNLEKWNIVSISNSRSNYYKLKVDAIENEVLQDTETVPFGIRKFEINPNNWSFRLNDEPVFIKAVNYIPIQHFSKADLSFYLKDMKLIQDANLNSVGIHAHIQPYECYEAADEMGILTFQDFPLQWSYDSSIKTNPGFREKACK